MKHLYGDRIVSDPGILGGKPVVKGTRISVEVVLEHLAGKVGLDDLLAAYPSLTPDDVRECLLYASVQLRRIQREKRAATRRLEKATA